MPVLVTAGATSFGLTLIGRLRRSGGQLRAYCDEDSPIAEVRQLGAHVAVGSLLDEGRLESAMEQVHTVVHLAVRLLADSTERLVEETATVVTGAVGAGVKRLVVLTLPGAAGDAGDPLRRAAGEIEELVADAPLPTVAVRPSLVDTPDLRHLLAGAVTHDEFGVDVAPVDPDDLAELVAFLDDRREALEDHVVLAADGPRRSSLAEFLAGAGRGRARGGGAQLLPGALSGPWTSDASVASGWALASIEPHPPRGASP